MRRRKGPPIISDKPPGPGTPPRLVDWSPPNKRVFRKTASALAGELQRRLMDRDLILSIGEIVEMVINPLHKPIGPAEEAIVVWAEHERRRGVEIIDDTPISQEGVDMTVLDFVPKKPAMLQDIAEAFTEAFPEEQLQWVEVEEQTDRQVITIHSSEDKTRTFQWPHPTWATFLDVFRQLLPVTIPPERTQIA